MRTQRFFIGGSFSPIPAILWGEPAERWLIGVHGNFSHKEDTALALLAERAVSKGYQVLSFDLPQHGERAGGAEPFAPPACVRDLEAVYAYAAARAGHLSLFGCSLGAYFSLLAYRESPLDRCLFLSPVVNMQRVIANLMRNFGVSEERLRREERIPLPNGQVLDWAYLCYVRSHPVCSWSAPTAILYGSRDDVSEWEEIESFVQRYRAQVQIDQGGEHFFHTGRQLEVFARWLDANL